MITISGSSYGFCQGTCLGEAAFWSPAAVCLDPLNPDCYYIGDSMSVRYCTPETVSLVAGGYRSQEFFDEITGLVCDGHRLFVADSSNHRIRCVDTKTRNITTVAGDGSNHHSDGVGLASSIHVPFKLTFQRSPNVKAHSVLFITAMHAIRRFDPESGQLTTCKWKRTPILNPAGIDSLPSGHLIVTSGMMNAVYLFDPDTGSVELLAGSGVSGGSPECVNGSGRVARFCNPTDAVIVDSEHCVYIADTELGRVRRMTLPASLFLND